MPSHKQEEEEEEEDRVYQKGCILFKLVRERWKNMIILMDLYTILINTRVIWCLCFITFLFKNMRVYDVLTSHHLAEKEQRSTCKEKTDWIWQNRMKELSGDGRESRWIKRISKSRSEVDERRMRSRTINWRLLTLFAIIYSFVN